MNFKDLYCQAILETPHFDSQLNPGDFITAFHVASDNCPVDFLSLLGGGGNTSDSFFTLSLPPMDCFFLLYTFEGSGKLKSGNTACELSKDSLLFLDCRQQFSLQPSILPWNFKLYFINAKPALTYASVLMPDGLPFICGASLHSPIPHFFNMLSTIPEHYTLSDAFSMHRHLTDLLCTLCQKAVPSQSVSSSKTPFYLLDMKQQLEKYYNRPFHLSDYEHYYKINKYRLCREFSSAFGKPPLQFLNQKRLDAAKELLLTTNLSIQEISSMVGYESCTHFINLFRRNTDITPGAFRHNVKNG